MIFTSETQYKIIDAYFSILQETPDVKKISLGMVAYRVGMRRESISKYHFKNVEEIRERIRHLVDDKLEEAAENFVGGENLALYPFISEVMLPHLYKYRDWLKILYGTTIDSEWQTFLLQRYTPLVERYLDEIEQKELISNQLLAAIIVKEILSIVSTWLTDNHPDPVFIFQKKFMHILQSSPYDLLTKSYNK